VITFWFLACDYYDLELSLFLTSSLTWVNFVALCTLLSWMRHFPLAQTALVGCVVDLLCNRSNQWSLSICAIKSRESQWLSRQISFSSVPYHGYRNVTVIGRSEWPERYAVPYCRACCMLNRLSKWVPWMNEQFPRIASPCCMLYRSYNHAARGAVVLHAYLYTLHSVIIRLFHCCLRIYDVVNDFLDDNTTPVLVDFTVSDFTTLLLPCGSNAVLYI